MKRLIRFAWFVLAFNVGVVLMGAVVRATGSGAGCGPSWPTCQGEAIPDLQGATSIEFTHRAISGVALVLVFVLALVVWRRLDKGHPARLGSILAVAAIVGEALIGAAIVLAEWVAEDTSVARAVSVPLHLVNTLFLLAALTLTVHWLSGGRRASLRAHPRVARWVIFGGLTLVLLAATGAVTALADTLFPKTSPGYGLIEGEHFLTRLRIVHPILATTAALVAWWVSGMRGPPRSRTALGIPILVGAMLLSGMANVFLGVPLWMQIVHLALADVLWIAYVLVSARALEVEKTVSVRS